MNNVRVCQPRESSVRPLIRSTGLILTSLVLLSACQRSAEEAPEAPPPWVLTAPITVSSTATWSLTGAVHARHEVPLSFRIGGKVLERRVDAGERVAAGRVLFRLDPGDVIQQRIAAQAAVASARAETENAERERARLADMLKRKLASQQDYDRAATAARAAKEQSTSAQAALKQALNAVEYAALTAPATGVVLEVTGQIGQVVTAGQPLATLAADGPLEAEVDVPEDRRGDLPAAALAYPIGGDQPVAATLREIAGSADPVTRTWRARYQLVQTSSELALGTTVTLRFAANGAGARPSLRVPLGAVLERGQGADGVVRGGWSGAARAGHAAGGRGRIRRDPDQPAAWNPSRGPGGEPAPTGSGGQGAAVMSQHRDPNPSVSGFNLSALAVRERSVTLFFILVTAVAGVLAFLQLGRAEDPAFTVRVMVVSALWPGASAQQMQELVADPLEKRISEVDYFYKVETTARPGRVDMLVEFQDYTPSPRVPDLFYQVRKRMLDEAAKTADRRAGAVRQRRILRCLFRALCPVRAGAAAAQAGARGRASARSAGADRGGAEGSHPWRATAADLRRVRSDPPGHARADPGGGEGCAGRAESPSARRSGRDRGAASLSASGERAR